MDNVYQKLGRCIGTMIVLLQHGKLNNDDWRQLARTYVAVSSENDWSKDDITWIREEAVRRGVDIGE